LSPDFVHVEEPVRHAALVERPRRRERRVGHKLDETVETEQARVELLPTGVRVLREADPELLGIRDTEDARPAVARTVVVVELELLVHRDLRATSCKLPRRRGAHDPGSDDRDLHAAMMSPG